MILESQINERQELVSLLERQLAQAQSEVTQMQSDSQEISDISERLNALLSSYNYKPIDIKPDDSRKSIRIEIEGPDDSDESEEAEVIYPPLAENPLESIHIEEKVESVQTIDVVEESESATEAPVNTNQQLTFAEQIASELPKTWTLIVEDDNKVAITDTVTDRWVTVKHKADGKTKEIIVNKGLRYFRVVDTIADAFEKVDWWFQQPDEPEPELACLDHDKPEPGLVSLDVDETDDKAGLIPSKKGISFAYTLEQLTSGQKSVTRRSWKDGYAQSFINTYRKSPQTIYPALTNSRGGECVGYCRLTSEPYQELLAVMPDSDLKLEGFPRLSKRQFVDKFFDADDQQVVWVIRFEFIPLDSESLKGIIEQDSNSEELKPTGTPKLKDEGKSTQASPPVPPPPS
ncbi:MAG: hypothetical protein F6K54_32645 [Okeania sp. SIO3B5]|uniref:hypothetical protein n=1 Tax=Okeania sp. SIO3B5 TaxID=2607811 RepID=UPI0013FFDA8F|nr:hypothetical protein [Okeania sp. SIO3B5]NEO57411.1 hypothetical protein [Okeania sp. SIO3B5]